MTMTTTKRKKTGIGALFAACLLLSASPACLTEDDWDAYNKAAGASCGSNEECFSGGCVGGTCLLAFGELCAYGEECVGGVCLGYKLADGRDDPNRICSQECTSASCLKGVCLREEPSSEKAWCVVPCGDDWDCAVSATCKVVAGQSVCWPIQAQP